VLPAASRAVTVRVFVPGSRAIPPTDQAVVPAAIPLPPALFVQETWVTATSSLAVPASASGVAVAAYVAAEVGVPMLSVGAVVSAAADGWGDAVSRARCG
jgi:hypothetical protein